MRIACFLLEPTDLYRRRLRRFCWSTPESYTRRGLEPPRACSSGHYHDADITLDTITASEAPASGDAWSHDDPRWPLVCRRCGYEFRATDEWQLNNDQVFRVVKLPQNVTGDAPSLGTPMTLRDAPAGAMWFADWLGRRGPDGRCLVVKTPAGEWSVDYPSTDGRPWERSGEPPDVTASPSIGIPKADGGYAYHAFLRAGHLEDA